MPDVDKELLQSLLKCFSKSGWNMLGCVGCNLRPGDAGRLPGGHHTRRRWKHLSHSSRGPTAPLRAVLCRLTANWVAVGGLSREETKICVRLWAQTFSEEYKWVWDGEIHDGQGPFNSSLDTRLKQPETGCWYF